MQLNEFPRLNLFSLAQRSPVIPQEAVGFYVQNCMICFEHNGHRSGVALLVNVRDENHEVAILWEGEVTEQLGNAYGDLKKATDNAACAIALLLVTEISQYTAVEQSAVGTTIDYYLAPADGDPDLIFNHVARLEVSGILRENPGNSVEARISKKASRLKKEEGLPTIIAVVEFSKPWSKVVFDESSSRST